jgi:hypothetical protein
MFERLKIAPPFRESETLIDPPALVSMRGAAEAPSVAIAAYSFAAQSRITATATRETITR